MESARVTEEAGEAIPIAGNVFRPSLVSWNLTRRCNLRCPHCYLSAGKKEEDELSTAECLTLLDDMKALGTEMVILTGGEPLLRKDIYDLATAASERDLWVVMGTNGVLLDDRVAQKMLECGVKGVGISIDSVDPAKHDKFRGGPDAWRYSMRALDVAKANGLEVLVQSTVMDMNRDEIPQLLELARERGAWSFNLYFLVQTGRGQEMNDLDAASTENLLGDLVDFQEEYRPMLVRSKCAPQFKRIAYERGAAGLDSGGCMAGTQYCRITPSGDVTPCPYMTVVAGNVREQSFREIWQSSPVLEALRNPGRLGGRCGTCEYQELCGGCRCRAYAATGDYLAEDPACPHEPTGIPLDEAEIRWHPEALARLERIPILFIREKVQGALEAFARSRGAGVVTPELMKEGMQGEGRPVFANMPDFVRQMGRPEREVEG